MLVDVCDRHVCLLECELRDRMTGQVVVCWFIGVASSLSVFASVIVCSGICV